MDIDPPDDLAAAALAFAQAIMRAAGTPAPLISIDEAARRLGVSRGTIRNLIAAGELEARHIGRRHLIVSASLDRLIGSGRALE